MSSVADVIIVGGGIAGIVSALELLDRGLSVRIVEKNEPGAFGGLAAWAFGGIFVVDSPLQRRMGIRDCPARAWADWCAAADFGSDDTLPRLWAKHYVESCREMVHDWLLQQRVAFMSPVFWVERGLFRPGNSVPRFHLVSGTGRRLVNTLIRDLEQHPNKDRLKVYFRHSVLDFMTVNQRVVGCVVLQEDSRQQFEWRCDNVVVATGGITGNLQRVRDNWYKPWGPPPATLLNGSHLAADGNMHDVVEKHGGRVANLDRMWNYAAGVHHPTPRHPSHGLSLLPPKNAVWVNAVGDRLGMPPLITGFDTRYLVEQICREEHKYSWQILNYRIAIWELGVSGSEFNDALVNPTWFNLLRLKFLGNRQFVDFLLEHCCDCVTAQSLAELVAKMNVLNGDSRVDGNKLGQAVRSFDSQIERGETLYNDDQLRRILHLRAYPGDRSRTCKPAKILDPRSQPLIAIREFIVTRKTLGGIQTDLKSRVLTAAGDVIPGLYAVGEAAGFGGGGMHGRGALEGTFLGGCILTARIAGQAIATGS